MKLFTVPEMTSQDHSRSSAMSPFIGSCWLSVRDWKSRLHLLSNKMAKMTLKTDQGRRRQHSSAGHISLSISIYSNHIVSFVRYQEANWQWTTNFAAGGGRLQGLASATSRSSWARCCRSSTARRFSSSLVFESIPPDLIDIMNASRASMPSSSIDALSDINL